MTGLFDALAAALRAEQPAALAEVIEGPAELLGGKLLVLPGPPLEHARHASAIPTWTG